MAKAIVITSFTDKIGGAERRFARTFLHLLNEKKDYFLFLPKECYEGLISQNIRVDERNNVVPINIRFNSMRIVEFFSCLVMLSAKHHIRYVHFIAPSVYSFLFAKFTPFSTSISVLDSFRVKIADFTLKKRIIRRFAIRSAARIDFLSAGIRDNMSRLFFNGQVMKDWFVSPCSFTDLEKIILSPVDRDLDVTFIGRLEKGKGLRLLFEAIDSANKMYSNAFNITFMICGDGALKTWVLEEIAKRPKNIIRLEWTDNPFEILSRTKIFVSLQARENYPSQSLLEAMASRCAIIATDVGETYKLVNDDCGLRIPKEADSLSRAILDLLNDEEMLANMGNISRQFVLKYHTIDKFSDYIDNSLLS